ncbi:MAG: TIGR04255 family protein [Candidatus Obscuribacterales bacterium]|nr:TIGR04255 family protein [Candidatus Obscuribacterales bacterium]
MPFPEFERCIYQKNPLEAVICQLRFPTVLRVDSEQPAVFQDAVRMKSGRAYPLYETRRDGNVPAEVEPLLPPEIGQLISTVHDFSSADHKWTISLNRGFLALSTKDYWRWEEFEEELSEIMQILQRIYSPAFLTRLGLRYQNVIRPLSGKEDPNIWKTYIQEYILGELAGPNIEAGDVLNVFTRTVIRLKNIPSSQVLLQHGLADFDGSRCYVIDGDFYTEQKTEVNDAIPLLRKFKEKSGRLFRWCITSELHQAMEPVSLTDDRAKRSECA